MSLIANSAEAKAAAARFKAEAAAAASERTLPPTVQPNVELATRLRLMHYRTPLSWKCSRWRRELGLLGIDGRKVIDIRYVGGMVGLLVDESSALRVDTAMRFLETVPVSWDPRKPSGPKNPVAIAAAESAFCRYVCSLLKRDDSNVRACNFYRQLVAASDTRLATAITASGASLELAAPRLRKVANATVAMDTSDDSVTTAGPAGEN
eukprot:jgi/Hompol1/3873/HPOL_006796-RA